MGIVGIVLVCLPVGAMLRSTARVLSQPTCAPMERSGEISIVLVAPDDAVARAIDSASGSDGWSHLYLDVGVSCDGARAVVDYTPNRGVHWASADAYNARGQARIVLEGAAGADVAECVSTKLGKPFRVLPMVIGIDSDAHCSGLLVHCLPPAMRRDLRERCSGAVSPNDVARYFGVRDVGDVVRVSAPTRGKPRWAF